jgi:Flp pilus assembly protein TadD
MLAIASSVGNALKGPRESFRSKTCSIGGDGQLTSNLLFRSSPRLDQEPSAANTPERDATPSNATVPRCLLESAIAHLELGNARAALEAASDACHNAPRLPRPHYVYGQAWLALNEPTRAEQAFAAAIQLAPDWAEPWINYGLARYRQGAMEDAKTAMRQALLLAPGHPAASANLGAFLRITGESEAAEALLRATVAREPGNAGARLNLAADLLHEERAGEALALLDQADVPEDTRASRHWHLQRSLALLQLGRSVEARAALDALTALGPLPPEIAPLWHWRQVLLGLEEGDPVRAREAAGRMEAALDAMGPAAVPEHRIMAHYDLAKLWSGQNEPTRAFAHWTAGHGLLAKSQPFSRDEHLASVEANIATFDRARFAEGPRARNRDPAPVFIVGMPRSGTTLCEQILAAHRDVHGAGERPALGRAFAALGGPSEDRDPVRRIAALDAEALDRAAAGYLAELHGLAPDKTRIVDKLPGNYLYLGLVGLMLPGAKIIHCVRDPRDIGLSIFTFRFHGQHGYAHDLADLGWTIAQQSRLMDHWKAVLPNPVLTVALADWVEDFDGTLNSALAHLDLEPDPNCARFYEADSRVRTVSRAQVRQPVNARGLGRWRAYADQLTPLTDELARGGLLPADPAR